MEGRESGERSHLPAGDFAAWVTSMQVAIRDRGESRVPCGGCTACCTSSQFVHVAPDETDTLARIPADLLVPAPRLPDGHMLLGYDERGHCPMLVEGSCSIYAHRPRACRTYDCRVFPAAGLGLEDDPDRAAIDRRARRWRFAHPGRDDRRRHAAVRAAAAFLGDHPELLPDGAATTPTQHAALAVAVHDVFLADRRGQDPDPAAIRVQLRRRLSATRA